MFVFIHIAWSFNFILFLLYRCPCQPLLSIDGQVDFGSVVANSKVIVQNISIVNRGSASGTFKLKYNGNKPITFVPSMGTVPPRSVATVKVLK